MLEPATGPPQTKKETEGKSRKTNLEVCLLNSHGLRAKGKSHQAAVRALAYKWIRIIYRCWQTRTNYDEARYMKVLRNKGSQLVPAVATAEA